MGVCVNDGDTQDGQGGQKGWSGWGPYAAVYGKTASATGLVSLVGDAPAAELTLSAEDMQYDANGASITLDGDASDWADAEFKSQIPFEKGGELVLFEEYFPYSPIVFAPLLLFRFPVFGCPLRLVVWLGGFFFFVHLYLCP